MANICLVPRCSLASIVLASPPQTGVNPAHFSPSAKSETPSGYGPCRDNETVEQTKNVHRLRQIIYRNPADQPYVGRKELNGTPPFLTFLLVGQKTQTPGRAGRLEDNKSVANATRRHWLAPYGHLLAHKSC